MIVWAPRNNLIFAWGVMITLRLKCGVSEMSLPTFGLCYVLLQVALFAFGGYTTPSEPFHLVFHLMGIAIGFPLGLAMVKLRWVDCEGWDLPSIMSGKRTYLTDKAGSLKDAEALNSKVMALRR